MDKHTKIMYNTINIRKGGDKVIKKALCIILVLLMALTFTACTNKSDALLTVGETEISSGIYTYYLDKVKNSPQQYGITEATRENIIEAAKECCLVYAGTIELMKKQELTLSGDYKRTAAQNTENIWSLFSQYYEKIGVTKQDITLIQTHECRKLLLLDHYFGASGINPLSDDELKEEFVDIYVGFKVIAGSLTKENEKGEIISLTDEEISQTEKLFEEMASKINAGTATIDELNVQYNNSLGIIVTGNLTTELMKDGDPMYDDGFFDTVMSITHGKAKVIKSGTSIYVLQRQTIATTDEDAFALYRAEVLETVKMPSVEKKIKKTYEKLSLEENERAKTKIEKEILGK